jgi:hypothetical protein
MPGFLRGRLVSYRQESLAPRDDPTVHEFLQVALEEGPHVTILDESCVLTASLNLRVGAASTYIVSPYWATRPQYHSVELLPSAVGRFERQVWWEEPIWWGGLVRDLHWHGRSTSRWWSARWRRRRSGGSWRRLRARSSTTPSSEDPAVKWVRGELGALVTWEQVYWFQLLAILA